MKKFKKILPFVLIAVMLLLTACNGAGSPAPNDPPPTNNTQNGNPPDAPTPPETDDNDSSEQDNNETPDTGTDDESTPDDSQIDGPPLSPPPDEIEEPIDNDITCSDKGNDPENDEADEWPDVILDGVGVPGSRHRLVGDDLFPNYVSLVPVAAAFGTQVTISGNEISLEGLSGNISFVLGSDNFTVNGTTVTLPLPAEMFDNVIYVPIVFFRDVFGAGSAIFSGGEVHISTEPDDMR